MQRTAMAMGEAGAADGGSLMVEMCARLGLEEFSVEGLQEASVRILGPERTARCLEAIAGHRLSRRYFQVGNLASLVAAHTTPSGGHEDDYPDDRVLPVEWWTRESVYEPFYDLGEERHVPPDDILLGRRFDRWNEPSEWRTVLDILSARAQDDTMPSVHDFIDLNRGTSSLVDPVRADGTALAVGDVVRLTYDPGYWVDAAVTEVSSREGSQVPQVWARCIPGTHRHTFCAIVEWAVDVKLRPTPVLLPGEVPGTGTDPYARPLVHSDLVREFLTRAAERDADIGTLLTEGTTLGDVHRAEVTREPARDSTALTVRRGLAAVLDERSDLLEQEMRWLRDSGRPPAGEAGRRSDG